MSLHLHLYELPWLQGTENELDREQDDGREECFNSKKISCETVLTYVECLIMYPWNEGESQYINYEKIVYISKM